MCKELTGKNCIFECRRFITLAVIGAWVRINPEWLLFFMPKPEHSENATVAGGKG
jgi:hypothetical protein